MKIPNQQPLVSPSGSARIAIIGAAPCRDEENLGALMTGLGGKLLHGALGQAGIPLNQCFVGNLSRTRPPQDYFGRFVWRDLQEDIAALQRDLDLFEPTIVLCLGDAPLHLFMCGNHDPGRRGNDFNWHHSIREYRGTLFESKWLPGLKCLGTYSMDQISWEFDLQAYLKFDIIRLRNESLSPILELPVRNIGVVGVHHSVEEAVKILAKMNSECGLVSVDIEGHAHNVTCIAFSRKPGNALVVPLAQVNGISRWPEAVELTLWTAIKQLLENPAVPKLAQNGFYDWFALAWGLGITVQNWQHDTILAWWELYPELKKGLATQASILTKEPYYKPDKSEGHLKFSSDMDFWNYNGIDAAVTLECHQAQMRLLTDAQKLHYQFNMSLAMPILYLMLRGIHWDKKRARAQRKVALEQAFSLQYKVDEAAGRTELAAVLDDKAKLASLILSRIGVHNPYVKQLVNVTRYQPMRWNGKKWIKKGKVLEVLPTGALSSPDAPQGAADWFKPITVGVTQRVRIEPTGLNDLHRHILPSEAKTWKRIQILLKKARPDQHAVLGELNTLLRLSVNISSTGEGGDAQVFLYDTCMLHRYYKDKKTGRYSMESEGDWNKRKKGFKTHMPAGKSLATDQQALDMLYARSQDIRILWVLQLRRLKKVAIDLVPTVDIDSRVRASISLLKETGRMSESKSPLNTGLNRQALNKDLRDICTADTDCVFIQRDLSGADSWTVAAECAVDEDTTMLDDLKAGLKPAKILALLNQCGESINSLDRTELKAKLKLEEPNFPSWLYAGAKACVHGSSYLMGHNTMIDTLLKNSMSDLPIELGETRPLVLTKDQVARLQDLFFKRYPGLVKWHQREGWTMICKGSITMSTGHQRSIFARKAEIKQGQMVPCHETLKAVLASKPQYYTTLGVKLALWHLWNDPSNRRDDGTLTVEPLILVHDSLLVQTRKADIEFARAGMHRWFDNEMEIAGQTLTIPADGSIAEDWSMKNAKPL